MVGDASDATVATIEHLLAALAGLGVDNALVEIDGPEVPIMDGSAAHFVEAIDQVGIVQLNRPRRYVKVLKTVRVEHGRAFSELRPAEQGFRLEVEIDFSQDIIGRQKKVIDLDPNDPNDPNDADEPWRGPASMAGSAQGDALSRMVNDAVGNALKGLQP